ncbi:hypothetical protein [Coleofasciculus sp. H7-2]
MQINNRSSRLVKYWERICPIEEKAIASTTVTRGLSHQSPSHAVA